MELYSLTQQTHDGHFAFVPDVIGNIFNFARPEPLVSVSADGKELPKPYVYADVLAESFGNATYTASAVSKINGQDAKEWLESWAQIGSLQDRDALYNNIFYELAIVSLGPSGSGVGTFAGGGRGRWIYPNATTELAFENGTSRSYENYARVLVDLTGITDGESLYKKYFTGPPPGTGPSNDTTPSPTPSPQPQPIPAPGYPPPVIRDIRNLIGGYYLEGDYSDVAVLSVPSFVGTDGPQKSFQDTAVSFLQSAKAAGKKKLVIDVSANGGGTILLGYELYKLLFPNNFDHAADDRIRAFESTNLIGKKFSELAGTFPRVLVNETGNETLSYLVDNIAADIFNYRSDMTPEGKNFENLAEKLGPLQQKGDNFTNLFRWNFSDVLVPLYSNGINIHGYGPLKNYTTQPFAAEDIVVVTEGYCASTCTIFSELMRQRAGVKYIALGGRPREGLTQAVGGVKGTNNRGFAYIQNVAQAMVTELNNTLEESQMYNRTEFGQLFDDTVFNRAAVNITPGINFRDGIRSKDLASNTEATNDIPLQFVFEEADCRILYTKPMTIDVTNIWKAVADTAWGGKDHCFAGSLGGSQRNSLAKRELTVSESVLSKKISAWRNQLTRADYPLEVFTDLSMAKLGGDGIMYP